MSDSKTGQIVECHPSVEDPEIVERQHRSACISKPHFACRFCVHSKFTLNFRTKGKRLDTIKCPRWENEKSRLDGEQPQEYIETEIATCDLKPFPYCPSCPSRKQLADQQILKEKDGWYSRWKRYNEEGEDGD